MLMRIGNRIIPLSVHKTSGLTILSSDVYYDENMSKLPTTQLSQTQSVKQLKPDIKRLITKINLKLYQCTNTQKQDCHSAEGRSPMNVSIQSCSYDPVFEVTLTLA